MPVTQIFRFKIICTNIKILRTYTSILFTEDYFKKRKY